MPQLVPISPLLNRMFVGEYYRKNALFFGLLLAGLVFIFRPPTTLIQPYFVLPMLEDVTFFSIVQGILLLYQIKAWRETALRFSQPEYRFLLPIIGLSQPARWRGWLRIYLGIMAPAMGYRANVTGYSIWAGSWHWVLLIGIEMLLMAGWMFQCDHLISFPRERNIRLSWQERILQRMDLGWRFLGLQLLWERHRVRLLLTKGGILVLLFLAIGLHSTDPQPDKAWSLVFLSLGILQIMLAYFLRQEEEDCLYLLRNLPLSRWQRWLGYLLGYALIIIPELVLLGLAEGSLDWVSHQWLSFATLEIGLLMLGTGLSYYQSMEPGEYLKWMFGAYVVPFFLILIGIPGWAIGLTLGLFGTWIGMEGFWQFQPIFKEEE